MSTRSTNVSSLLRLTWLLVLHSRGNNNNNDTSTGAVLDKLVELQQAALDLNGKFIEQLSTPQSEDRITRKWTRLGAHSQKLILFASKSIRVNDPPEEPVPRYKAFLEMTQKQALSHLQTELEVDCRIACAVDRLLSDSLFMGHFQARRADEPARCSVFYFGKSKNLDTMSGLSDTQWAVYSENKLITPEMAKAATTSQITVATSILELQLQIRNYIKFLKWLTVQDAADPTCIVVALEAWPEHLDENLEVYESLAARDPQFIAKVLQTIATGVDLFFKSCHKATAYADVDEQLLDFRDVFRSIERRESLQAIVPAMVLQAVTRPSVEESESPTNKTPNEGGPSPPKRQKRGGDGPVPAKNDSVPEGWKQPSFDKFRKYIADHKNDDPVPQVDGIAICVKYQCTGICVMGDKCTKKATHKKLTGEVRDKFNAWVVKAVA